MDVSKILDCNSVEEQDLVSQYVGRKLSPEEAEAFEEHYFGCDRCWAEVQAATEVRAAVAGSPVSQRLKSPRTNWRLLAIAASIAVAVLAGLLLSRGGTRKTPLEAVVAAAGSRRATEARLTGGFPHAEVESIIRGESGPAKPWRLQKALEDAQREVERNPSAEAWRAVGVAELLLGDHDQAVRTLKNAVERYPGEARIQSDLAAAYFARFEALGQSTDLESGYEAAARAVKLDPKLLEARFNRALILERLGHRGSAAEAWDAYRKLEMDKNWAAEAIKHYNALSGPPLSQGWPAEKDKLQLAASRGDRDLVAQIVGRFPDRSRLYVEEEVLPRWTADPSPTSRDLKIAREVALVFQADLGDSLLADSVALIDRSLSDDPPRSRLAQIVEAHRLYGAARRSLKRRTIEEHAIEDADRAYGSAERLFEIARSPFRDLAITGRASCLFFKNDVAPIPQVLAPVIRRSKARYPQLFAWAQWIKGLAELSLGHPSEALQSYTDALSGFERIGDIENVASVHYLMSEVCQDVGEFEAAAEHRRQALTMLTQTGEPSRLYAVFALSGGAAEQAGLPELARLAYASAARSAQAARSPDILAHALIATAETENTFGNRQVALQYLDQALAACRAIQDRRLRERASAELNIVVGQIEGTANLSRSLQELATADTFFRKKGDLSRLVQVHFERGKLHLAARTLPMAAEDFLAAIGILERMSNGLSGDATRASFFESSQDVFDHAIATLVSVGRVQEAAQVLEQARARALLDMIAASVPARASPDLYQTPLSEDALRRAIPPLTMLVEYVSLPDRLLIFTMRPDGVRLASTPVRPGQVEELTRLFLGSDEQADKDLAANLYRLVISPIQRELEGCQTVIFIPDKSLYGIPFAGLRNPESGRYLVQDFRVGVSPSATIYVRGMSHYRALAGKPVERVLLVANPRVDRSHHPQLRPRLEADREVREVAALYPGSFLLDGPSATKRRFLAEAPSASLIHLASHAISARTSILSELVLAQDPATSDSGLLYAHEITALRLPRTRMVILSACATLGGPERRGEGALSLARAFLATGVPAVLGTLTPVTDRAAARILTTFHQRLAAGETPMTALRNAQLSLLGGRDPDLRSPRSWASFQMIGGTPDS